MTNSGSLTKLKVWQKAKETILKQMNGGIIKSERADNVLLFIKKTLKNIDTIEGLGMYCDMLGKRFPELTSLIESIKSGEQEKLDHIVGLVLEKLMEGGHFETAEELIGKLNKIENIQEEVNIIKQFSPKEFEEVYKNIFEA